MSGQDRLGTNTSNSLETSGRFVLYSTTLAAKGHTTHSHATTATPPTVRQSPRLSQFKTLNTIILPRQARDKHRESGEKRPRFFAGIGRVLLRRDGFASLSHDDDGTGSGSSGAAVVVTQPFVLMPPRSCIAVDHATVYGSSSNDVEEGGGEEGVELVLMLNVKVAAGGSVRVALADATTTTKPSAGADAATGAGANAAGGDKTRSYAELPRFSLAASDAIGPSTDAVRAVVSWGGRSGVLAELGGRSVAMTVELRHAQLFALEWRCISV
eukprot:COSAG06_NODE_784_length_12328_cov_4.921416_11_plen_270_part_00